MKPSQQAAKKTPGFPGGNRPRQPSSAARILSRGPAGYGDDYSTMDWLLLFATLIVICLICFCFTPYTHQLDEIKNVFLQFFPPVLLIWAVVMKDFRSITWKTQAPVIFLGLYTLFMTFSWAINDYKIVNERVIWFHAGCATFTIIFAWFINSENKMRKVILFWVLLALASALLGILFYAGHIIQSLYNKASGGAHTQWGNLFYTLLKAKDMYSFILNEDFYAAFILMLCFFPAAMFFAEDKRRYKILGLVTFILLCICMAFTYSNDTFISALFGVPLFVGLCLYYGFRELLSRENINKFTRHLTQPSEWTYNFKLGLTVFACLSFLLLEVLVLMWPRLSSAWEFKAEAFSGRIVLWSGGFWPWLYGKDWTRQHLDFLAILFGVGPGGYRHYFPWFRSPDYFDNQINNVTTFGHNWYLDVLLETGVVGLVLFMAFFLIMFKYAIHQIRTTSNRRILFYQIAVVSGLVSISIQNISSPNNRWAVAGMTYWALMGMCLGIVSLERSNGPRRNTSDPVSGGQESLVPILAKGLVVLFAAAFLVRSSFMHAWQYWDAAKLNAAGLQLMETAETLQDEGRKLQYLDAARQSFEKAIESNPTFVTSYYKLANVYNSLGQIENYKLANAPKDPKYTDLAIAQYERLNELEPSYSEIHLNLGIMYMIKADQVVEEPAFLNGQADDLTKEAAKSKGQEKAALLEEAGRLREKAASLEKQAPEMRLQYLVKSKDALKEAARQSVKANVQWIAAQQAEQLAALLEKVGKSEQAVQLREDAKKFYSKIVTYKPKIDEAIKYKEFYYKRAQERLLKLARYAGNTEEERDVLKQCVAENPSDRGLINELMMVYDRLNRPKEKIEYLEQAVRDNPIDPYVRRVLAEAYLKSGDPDKYKQELKRLEILAPLDKTAISGLYLSYKDSDSTRTQIYKQKLAQIGVNADEVTTLITEQMSTATLGKPSAAAVQAALAKAKTAATSPSIVSTASLSPQ